MIPEPMMRVDVESGSLPEARWLAIDAGGSCQRGTVGLATGRPTGMAARLSIVEACWSTVIPSLWSSTQAVELQGESSREIARLLRQEVRIECHPSASMLSMANTLLSLGKAVRSSSWAKAVLMNRCRCPKKDKLRSRISTLFFCSTLIQLLWVALPGNSCTTRTNYRLDQKPRTF